MTHSPDSYKPNTSRYPFIIRIVLILILLVPIGFGIYNFKHIQNFFTTNIRKKLIALDKKIQDGFANGKFNKNVLMDYESSAIKYTTRYPDSPESMYFLARYHYLNALRKSPSLNSQLALSFILSDTRSNFSFPDEFDKNITEMYRFALRAEILGIEYEFRELNLFFLYYFDCLKSRKKSESIIENLKKINPQKLHLDMIKPYIWTNVVTSVQVGDIEHLEKILDYNEKQQNQYAQIKFKEQEIGFYKGLSHYSKNNYIQSLKYLRTARTGEDKISIQSVKLEAKIFAKQNLTQKGIDLLDNFYLNMSIKDESIRILIAELISTQPKLLKSKIFSR